jgi:S1-C subfamily serine protease
LALAVLAGALVPDGWLPGSGRRDHRLGLAGRRVHQRELDRLLGSERVGVDRIGSGRDREPNQPAADLCAGDPPGVAVGGGDPYRQWLGSGVIYNKAGNIVTNAHGVGSATSFQVQLANSTTALSATLAGTFPADDLAVIKVNGAKNLHPGHLR